jgi:hypothetical protein
MIRLKHSQLGLTAEIKKGFSWTTLFFGVFVPLFRGMIGYAGIMFLANICTIGLAGLYFPFVINKAQAKILIEKGYKPASYEDAKLLENLGIGYRSEQVTEQIAA